MQAYWRSMVKPTFGRDTHRPQGRDAMRSAARGLAARGLRPQDIAEALKLTEQTVRQLLEVRQ